MTDAGKLPKRLSAGRFLDRATAIGTIDSEPEPDADRTKSRESQSSLSSLTLDDRPFPQFTPEGRGGTLPDAVAQIDGSGPRSGDPPLFPIAPGPTVEMELSPVAVQHSTMAARRRTAPPILTPGPIGLGSSRDSLRIISQEACETPLTP